LTIPLIHIPCSVAFSKPGITNEDCVWLFQFQQISMKRVIEAVAQSLNRFLEIIEITSVPAFLRKKRKKDVNGFVSHFKLNAYLNQTYYGN